MKEKVSFLNMFPDYAPPEPLKGMLSQAAVSAADIDPEERTVTLHIHSDTYIPKRLLDEACNEVCGIYVLRKVMVSAQFPAAQLTAIEPAELMGMFVEQKPITRGSLAGASWLWEEHNLKVQLKGNGKDMLTECIPYVTNKIKALFGVAPTIEIVVGEELTGQALFDAMEEMRSQMIRELPRAKVSEKAAPVKPEGAIFGRPFKTAPVSMNQLNLDMGSVVVEGRVFAVDNKEKPRNNAWVISFDLTDRAGSVRGIYWRFRISSRSTSGRESSSRIHSSTSTT